MQPKLMTKIDKTFDEQDQALKYSEDEPRDEAGRWSASGASDNPTATAARFAKSEGTAKMHSDDHHVTWFSRAGGHFAQGYTANEKERAGVASPNESKVAERFRQDYKVSEARHGFAGSGSGVYTHVATGRQFSAEAMPNGKGFWGTDHVVTELPKGVRDGAIELEQDRLIRERGDEARNRMIERGYGPNLGIVS